MTSQQWSGTDWYSLSAFQSGLVVSLSLAGALIGSGVLLIKRIGYACCGRSLFAFQRGLVVCLSLAGALIGSGACIVWGLSMHVDVCVAADLA